jgi:hypothetical protein
MGIGGTPCSCMSCILERSTFRSGNIIRDFLFVDGPIRYCEIAKGPGGWSESRKGRCEFKAVYTEYCTGRRETTRENRTPRS